MIVHTDGTSAAADALEEERGDLGQAIPSRLPVILVHLDPSRGVLSWKPDATKGARWRGGLRSMSEVCEAADAAGLPAHCLIEFVEDRA